MDIPFFLVLPQFLVAEPDEEFVATSHRGVHLSEHREAFILNEIIVRWNLSYPSLQFEQCFPQLKEVLVLSYLFHSDC